MVNLYHKPQRDGTPCACNCHTIFVTIETCGVCGCGVAELQQEIREHLTTARYEAHMNEWRDYKPGSILTGAARKWRR